MIFFKKIIILIGMLGIMAGFASCTKHSNTSESVSEHAEHSAKKELYRCSMHPAVTSDKPGQICPICHMDLEKVEDDVVQPSETTTDISGRGSFSLSKERQQMTGVTTGHVITRRLSYEVRASGRVAFDPDLFTAIEEYRQAVMSKGQMTDSIMQVQVNDLIASAKTKLKLLGLSDQQIRSLSSKKSSSMDLLLPSGSVWIYAEVFEYEVAGLKAGLEVEVETPSIPNKIFSGKLSSINPVVNSPTRTVRVRALVPDPDSLLRPETFVNVKIKIDLGEKLAIPESAVLFSGEQKYVFVVKEQGHFSPRAIEIGLNAQDHYEVVSGLQEGEVIVTSANFLIDSESRLRGVLENSSQAPSSGSPAPASHGGH